MMKLKMKDFEIMAKRYSDDAAHLLIQSHQWLRPLQPAVTLDEALWLLASINNLLYGGEHVTTLPYWLEGAVSSAALNQPEHQALREALDEGEDPDAYTRYSRQPQMQFAQRLAQMSPTEALALLFAAKCWLAIGDRANIRESLEKWFNIPAAA